MRYIFYASMAWIRGFFISNKRLFNCKYPTTTTGLNGNGEAKIMFYKHGWIPYAYRKTKLGTSRTFITE